MSEGANLVGVDIGSSSVKVCQIEESKKTGRTLVYFGHHPLPPQTIVDGHVMNPGAVVEGLEKLFHKAKRRDVAIRVSGHSVIIKKITLPLMTPAELSQQITWEAEQHIPFDLSEVQMDYQELNRRQEQGQMDVLLVAAKREEIVDLSNLAIQARLRPKVVDLDAFALQNCYEIGYGAPGVGQTVVLLHMGASLTTLNILAQGTTAFTRDITHAGNTITEEIQRAMGISFEEAENLKCEASNLSAKVPPEVHQIVEQASESLAGEIQRSLDFYLATSGSSDIHKIFVSGGSANCRALVNAVGRRSGASIETLDPLLAATPNPQKVDANYVQGMSAQATVSFGLALRKDKEKRV
jgi:type IV pilus assembly protein PilM